MEIDEKHDELEKLMRQNLKLVKENNQLLKKVHRNALLSFWATAVWYAALIGLPFALYFYIFEPYFMAFGSDYETFKAGIQEIPGLKSLNNVIGGSE